MLAGSVPRKDFWCSTAAGGEAYDRLGDGLADGVDLGSVTTTRDADPDVDVGYSNPNQ